MAEKKPQRFFKWFPKKKSFWFLFAIIYIAHSLLNYNWNLVLSLSVLIAVFLWNLFFFYIVGYISYEQGFKEGIDKN